MRLMYLEINLICLFIITILSFKLLGLSKTTANRRLLIVYFGVAGFTILDWLDYFLEGSGISIPLHYTVDIMYYITAIAVPFFWFRYILAKLRIHHNMSKKILFLIPGLVAVAVILLSPLTKWFFYIDEFNEYHRSVLYFIQPVISSFYLFVPTALFLFKAIKGDERASRTMARLYILGIVPILAGVGEIFITGVPLIPPCVCILLMVMFMALQSEMISTDSLTGTNNRRELEKYAKALDDNEPASLILIDIDNFKIINDAFGHIAGDNALIRVAKVLKAACANKAAFLARYGGDEFIIVLKTNNYTEVSAFVGTIKRAVLETNIGDNVKLSISCGATEFDKKELTLSQCIANADKELYRDKQFKASLL